MNPTDPQPFGPETAAEALELNRACPIEADFTFYFERDPDFFLWPRNVFHDYQYWGVRDAGRLVGYGMLAQVRGWTGDRWGLFGYGGDARVLPEYRRTGIATSLLEGITREVPPSVEVGYWFMKAGNTAIEGFAADLEQRPEDPDWNAEYIGGFTAYNVFFVPDDEHWEDFFVRRATLDDVPAIVALQERELEGRLFAPSPDPERLAARIRGEGEIAPPEYWVAERGGEIVGSLGLWDIGPMHRVRVLERSFKAEFTALGYEAYRLAHPELEPLPDAGGVFRSISTIDLAIQDREPEILRSLLSTTLRAYTGAGLHFLQIGFMNDDPLRAGLAPFRAVPFESNVAAWYRREWKARVAPNAITDPYIDLTLL